MKYVNPNISPLAYVMAQYDAIDKANDNHCIQILTIDIAILHTLYWAPKGIRCRPLMITSYGRRVNEMRFHNALIRLLSYKHLKKRRIRKSVYYYITLTGRALLEELNDNIADIAEQRFNECETIPELSLYGLSA